MIAILLSSSGQSATRFLSLKSLLSYSGQLVVGTLSLSSFLLCIYITQQTGHGVTRLQLGHEDRAAVWFSFCFVQGIWLRIIIFSTLHELVLLSNSYYLKGVLISFTIIVPLKGI